MGQALPAVMAISAIIGTATAVYSAKQQWDAADEAREIADRNADMKRLETEETARRLEKNQEREVSRAKARAMASGIDPESESYKLLLEDISTTQQEELDWLKKSGARQADIIEDQGSYIGAQAETQALTTMAGVFGSAPEIYGSGQTAGWWR